MNKLFQIFFITYIIISYAKMKTNSSAKKRFKVTGTDKVLATQTNKRHNIAQKKSTSTRNQRVQQH